MTIFANPERLQAFISSIFTTAGSSASEAEQIASHLVGANLAGHDSHGIGLIPAYLAHLEAGLHVGGARVRLEAGPGGNRSHQRVLR